MLVDKVDMVENSDPLVEKRIACDEVCRVRRVETPARTGYS